MKKFASLMLLALMTTLVSAQNSTPQLMKLQGSLTDNTGTPVDGTATMTFVMYDASTGGLPLATIGPQPVVVSNGLYEVDLSFGASLFSASSRYIEITVNGEVLNPRVQLVSTPFAYNADKLDGLEAADFVKKVGDTMTGSLTVQGTIESTTGGVKFPDGTIQATAATQASVGNTLGQAYNQGGPGAGRSITASSGAVNIAGPDGLTVNGSVGIGKTNPGAPLDVQGEIRAAVATTTAYEVRSVGATPYIDFTYTSPAVDFDYRLQASTAGFKIVEAPANISRLVIASGGNVGLGTTQPAYKLDVNGDIKAQALHFADGTTQTTASAAGAQGPPGPRGPAGPAVTSYAVCAQLDVGDCFNRSCSCSPGTLLSAVTGPCTVTSDTSSCSANVIYCGFPQVAYRGECCVCKPN